MTVGSTNEVIFIERTYCPIFQANGLFEKPMKT